MSTMKPLHHPQTDDLALETVLGALSDPGRLAIVAQLAASGELACRDLDIGVAPSTASHHCKTLREAGVVRTRAQGTERLMTLRREDLDARFPGLLTAILEAIPPRPPRN